MPEIINKCPALHIDTQDPEKDEGKVDRLICEAIEQNQQHKELFAWAKKKLTSLPLKTSAT